MIIEAPKLKKKFVKKVEEIVGPAAYSLKNLDRLNYSRDSTFRQTIQIKYNKVEHFPDIIAWPQAVPQVQELVCLCARHGIPMVPYGAGSGVAEGTLPVRGGLICDMKKMRQVVRLDENHMLITCQTGIMGLHLEEYLERHGYTLGHFPSSILCASLGGYLAARSAGQKSTRYGKIEDMVTALQIVTGRGNLLQTRPMANTSGIDLNHVFLGSEGTLGLITEATLRIYPRPSFHVFRGLRFKDMKTAMEAIRRMLQSGVKPAVVRLYDEIDTLLFLSQKKNGSNKILLPKIFDKIKLLLESQSLQVALMAPKALQLLFKNLPSGCLLILMHEGHERLVTEEGKICFEIAQGLGAEDLGEEPGRNWYAHRYSVSYKASPLFYHGAFTDTIEVAATWDKLYPLYQAMIKTMSAHAMVMAHLSHVYPDGGSLYFTFVAPLKGLKKSVDLYNWLWDRAMHTCQRHGGVISHHHGVGRLKAKYMEEEWGEGVKIFKSLKNLYDPHGIMNPGKLFLEKKEKLRKAA